MYEISPLQNVWQDIYMFTKGHLIQHQERSCKGNISNTFPIPLWFSFQTFKFSKVYFFYSYRLWEAITLFTNSFETHVCSIIGEPYSDHLHCILFLIDFGNCPCPSGIHERNPFQWHLMYLLASSVLV